MVDPLAGSYFVESLTDAMEKAAWDYIEKIDKMGGIVEATEQGYPQREIARSAYEFQRQVDAGDRKIVGVNAFRDAGEGDRIPTLKIDLEPEKLQIERVTALRGRRDAAAVERALADVRAAIRDPNANVMPPILAAVKAYATLGEVCDIFRTELGEHRDPAYL